MRSLEKLSITVLVTLLGLFILFLIFNPLRVISAGTVGVVMRWGEVTGRTLEPGLHAITPIAESVEVLRTRKTTYETSPEHKQKTSKADYKDWPVDTNTSDGQQVDISYTIRFSIDSFKAGWIVENLGGEKEAVEKVIKTESRIDVRNVVREYAADVLYTGAGTQEVQGKLEESLRPVFEVNGLYLDRVGIREIKFSDDYVNEIEDKQLAAVRVETAENKADEAEFTKQAEIRMAEAQAEAQRLQRETLNEIVIEKLRLEIDRIRAEALLESARNGQPLVPQTYTVIGEGALPLIQLPTNQLPTNQ